MYCIKCGVELADSEKSCPLCGTVPFHPDIPQNQGESLYPVGREPSYRVSKAGALTVIITLFFLMPAVITLMCDLHLNKRITWSGYVLGALALLFYITVFPAFFKKPNPVIFVPCGFAVAAAFVFYIHWATEGNWYFSFALPIIGFFALVVTAVIALVRYVRRGFLYIFGGALLSVGAFMPVMEVLLNLTFRRPMQLLWSEYPLMALALLGGMLIFLAINRPARESMERKFFI